MKTRVVSTRNISAGLLIFCGILNAAESTGANYFNVRNDGAVGAGKNLDSPAINRAIDAAAAEGGGTVFVPAGTYLSGSIHLTNHINLFLDVGAVLLGEKWDSRLRNILISNVIADGVDKLSGIQIMGLPEQPIERGAAGQHPARQQRRWHDQ